MRKILIACFLAMSLQALSQQKIVLLDKESGAPIAFAHFLYENQHGNSSPDGSIQIQYIDGKNLTISHVNYGKISISPQMVKAALTSGRLHLKASYISLLPTTVIARKSDQKSENLDISISDKLSHDAGDFLGQAAFISGIRKSGSYGFDPVLRGFKYEQINIIMDEGISASAACPNRMDPPISQIPLNMVDRVEIVKGPHSLRYGASFGGSIHFKSKHQTYSEKREGFGRATAGFESNGNIFRSEVLAGIKGQNYHLGLFGAYSEGSNYTDGNGDEVQSAFNRRNLGMNASVRINKMQHLNFTLNSNYAHNVDFPALNMDLSKDDTQLLSVNHKINFKSSALASVSTSASASFVDHIMDNLDKELNPRKVNAITKAKTRNYAIRSEAALQLKEQVIYTGIDYKSEQAKGHRTREMLMGPMIGTIFDDNIWQDSKIEKLALFTEYHHQIGESFMVLSGRLEQNWATSREKDQDFLLANPNPASTATNLSLSAGIEHSLDSNWQMGLWLGRAARSGSLTERYINYLPVDRDPYERIGNPELKSEINYQIDLNLSYRKGKFQMDLNLFHSWLRNYISSEIRSDLSPKLATAAGIKQYVNIKSAVMRGFELKINQQLGKNVYQAFNLAYTYGENKSLHEPLPEIPPLDIRYKFGVEILQSKLNPEFTFRYAARQNRVSQTYGESKSPDFMLVDCKLDYKLSKQVRISSGIRNLFDTAYYEHLNRAVKGSDNLSIYAPGRSFYLSVHAQF